VDDSIAMSGVVAVGLGHRGSFEGFEERRSSEKDLGRAHASTDEP
jgi:hypothetical protein